MHENIDRATLLREIYPQRCKEGFRACRSWSSGFSSGGCSSGCVKAPGAGLRPLSPVALALTAVQVRSPSLSMRDLRRRSARWNVQDWVLLSKQGRDFAFSGACCLTKVALSAVGTKTWNSSVTPVLAGLFWKTSSASLLLENQNDKFSK